MLEPLQEQKRVPAPGQILQDYIEREPERGHWVCGFEITDDLGKSSSQTCREFHAFKDEQGKDRPPGGSVVQQRHCVALGQTAHGGGPSQQDTIQGKWSEPATTQKGERGLREAVPCPVTE